MKRVCFVTFVILLWSSLGIAQTLVISDTSRPVWGTSADNDVVTGVPPVPKVTSYRGELWLKANVVNNVPQGTPILTLDLGKPPIVAGDQQGPLLKPSLAPGNEYILFVSAVGPGGVSARTPPSVPFALPSPALPPAAPTGPVRFTP